MSSEISIKPTARVMQLCNEMHERKQYGKDYPSCWMVKTREALEKAGVVTEVGGIGKHYYFTCAGLAWYLKNKK